MQFKSFLQKHDILKYFSSLLSNAPQYKFPQTNGKQIL